MCWFISGTLPRGADLAAVRSIVGPEGSAWRPFTEAALKAQLPRAVDCFSVTASSCDCQTVLGSARHRKGKGERLPRAAARWSETKKRRWLEQRHVLIAQEDAAVHGGAVAWHEYVRRVVAVVPQGPIGLFLSWADSEGAVHVREPVAIETFRPAEFLRFEERTLYQFVSKGK